ncbi:MAG TPA: methyltransferase domain-containing protein [Chloroflexota bacterium]|jgi:SAM-dependent methyltransferase|nr:methyltransferase domain-containing protein [Chloroflexota bacterium]
MLARSAPPDLDPALLRRELQKTYAKMALFPKRRYHLNTGRALAELVGYPADALSEQPPPSIEAFSGAGYPLGMIGLRRGDALLDVGCGGGLDLLLAARAVGPTGRAVGIDLTPEMVQVARTSAKKTGLKNTTVDVGLAEKLPYPDGAFDAALSNNVINNCAVDKLAVLAEIRRVLKPGGALAVADVMVARPIPDGGRAEIGLWTC